jgi:hypothetical protein
MPLTRLEHWDTRHYDAHLREHAKDTFAWGQNDCCLSAANAIESFTGTDIAQDFRGKYDDERGAYELIAAITGGQTVADAVAWCARKYGLLEHTHPLLAKRGDLVLVENGGTQIAGTVHLNGRHVICMSAKGLVRLPISKVVRSWGV